MRKATPPAKYFPPDKGKYEIKPGLFKLGLDFGNGHADRHMFQIDSDYHHYHHAKINARAESLSKYYQTRHLGEHSKKTMCQFIMQRLANEHPRYFAIKRHGNITAFGCEPSRQQLLFDEQMQLLKTQGDGQAVQPAYYDCLDALGCQLQEDLAIIKLGKNGDNHVAALHLCFPNHWSAEEKIGKDFGAIHAPVPGMARIIRRSDAIVSSMINNGPFVRFAWGLSTDRRLNHHPVSPAGIAERVWQGRHFNPREPKLFLRIERQVIKGFPDIQAALFSIHTYFTDCATLKQDPTKRNSLIAAIQSMNAASLRYKGLHQSKKDILEWLASGSQDPSEEIQ
jgi:hypothetical protein